MTVSSTTATTNSKTDTSSAQLPIKVLNQQDFLTLLVKQMTSQDPLNPQKDTDFIAQMAQFTSLEQTKTMENEISQMRDSQAVFQASSLIGSTVELQTTQNGQKSTIQGLVSAVQIEAGIPKLIVGGQKYDLSQLVSVSQASNNPNLN